MSQNAGCPTNATDPDDLQSMLLHSADAGIRKETAILLGKLGDTSVSESLIRSALGDPDLMVRETSRTALKELLGAEAENAIEAYGPLPEDEPFFPETMDDDPKSIADEEHPSGWTEDELKMLILFARDTNDPAMQIKSIQQLSKMPDMAVVGVLAQLASLDEDSADGKVITAAQDALQEIYGEDWKQVADSYQSVDDEQIDEITETEPDAMIKEEPASIDQDDPMSGTFPPSISPYNQTTPVIQEDRSPVLTILLIGLILTGLILMIIFISNLRF